MAKDASVETKAKEVIRQAIAALKARGFDVNAYSVAVEARLPRWFIANNTTLMHLVAEARGVPAANGNGDANAAELMQKVQKLTKELDESTWENTVLRRYFQESKNENQALRDEINRAQQELARRQQDGQNSANQVQMAWQQGYIAGQQSVLSEPGRSPANASAPQEAPGTAYGAPEAPAQGNYEWRNTSEHVTAYVADAPLHIADPEVLADPFTAKLLDALQKDELIADEGATDSTAATADMVDTPSPQHAAPGEAEPSGFQDDDRSAVHSQRDLIDARMLDTDSDITDRFTAEDLHSLFQNRYVRHDEPPDTLRTTTVDAPQQAKKFVGGKHASSSTTEALPAVPRSVPPEIRKACKLLGVVPEEVTRATVMEAWKHEMAKPGVHPDTGGDTEMAIYLNTAKDTLLRWIENQTPKLGKKFGQQAKTGEAPKPRKQE